MFRPLIAGGMLATLRRRHCRRADHSAGLFPRQDHQHCRRRQHRRRLRHLFAAARAAHGPPHRRQSALHRPEHARRRHAAGDQLHLGGGAQGRHLLRLGRRRHGNRGAARRQERPLRRAPLRLDRLDELGGRPGAVLGADAVQVDPGRDEAGVHRRRRWADVGQCRLPDGAEPGGRHALQGDRRLQEHRRYRDRDRARRAQRHCELSLFFDHRPQPGLADQKAGERAAAIEPAQALVVP